MGVTLVLGESGSCAGAAFGFLGVTDGFEQGCLVFNGALLFRCRRNARDFVADIGAPWLVGLRRGNPSVPTVELGGLMRELVLAVVGLLTVRLSLDGLVVLAELVRVTVREVAVHGTLLVRF